MLLAIRRANRRWLLAIGLGLFGGGIAAGLVAWMFPVRYEAFALLKVAGKPPVVLGRLADSAIDEFAIFKRTQVELIKSNVVMYGTFRAKEINQLSMVQEHSDDPVAWLRNELIIDYPNDAEVLRIAMKGTQPAEVTKIVNQVVATYLKEIVQHEKELRNSERTQLERTLIARTRELSQEMESLHKLEMVQGVGSSESVQLQKKLLAEQLAELIAERRDIVRDLRQSKLQIMLAEARQEGAQDAPATEAPAASKDPASIPLPILEKQKEFLDAAFEEAEKAVSGKALELQKMEKFSAEVASKRERLVQQQRIATQIDERLNLIGVESLAQDRITKLDDATVPSGNGDVVRKWTGAALAAVLTFGLIAVVVGFVVGGARSAGA